MPTCRSAIRAVGLGAVLDNGQPVPRGDFADRLHGRWPAVEVHGDDGPGPRPDPLLDPAGIDEQRVVVDVDHPRRGSRLPHGADRGRGGVRDGDHFIPAADPQGAGDDNRAGPRSDGDGVAGADIRGKFPLECLSLRPENQVAGADRPPQSGFDLASDLLVAAQVVKNRNHARCGQYLSQCWRKNSTVLASPSARSIRGVQPVALR